MASRRISDKFYFDDQMLFGVSDQGAWCRSGRLSDGCRVPFFSGEDTQATQRQQPTSSSLFSDHVEVRLSGCKVRTLAKCYCQHNLLFLKKLVLFLNFYTRSNKTPTWCNTVQVLFLQSHSTCFGCKRPSSGVFKTGTAATGTCVIVAGNRP